ncbi:hypothetical protein NC652_029258 [Populus alba x Populus x berolinensis]|nr:hypothetical protein NC652_029258 [Populus alba x Populus x berolinensis]
MDDEIHRYKATNLPPEVNGNSSCFSRLDLSRVADDHVIRNEKDADEYLRGFSPGFDRPAFAVEGEPDFDSGPPEERLEHLRRVRWEAHILKVKVAKLDRRRWEDAFLDEFPELLSRNSVTLELMKSNPMNIPTFLAPGASLISYA